MNLSVIRSSKSQTPLFCRRHREIWLQAAPCPELVFSQHLSQRMELVAAAQGPTSAHSTQVSLFHISLLFAVWHTLSLTLLSTAMTSCTQWWLHAGMSFAPELLAEIMLGTFTATSLDPLIQPGMEEEKPCWNTKALLTTLSTTNVFWQPQTKPQANLRNCFFST